MRTRIINGVFGLAINSKTQVLLTQRYQPQHPQVHLKWQIPGGGQEAGEHLEDTLRREIEEELSISDLKLRYPHPLVDFNVWDLEGEGTTHVNLFTYIIDIGSQKPVINDIETNDWKWIEPNDISQLDLLPKADTIIRQALEIYRITEKK